MSADINAITGGKYQLVAEVWDRILSQPSEPYNFERFVKGDVVELTTSEAKRLVSCGAFVEPGEFERRAVEQLKAQLALAEAELAAAQERVDQAESGSEGGEGKSVTTPTTVEDILAFVGDDKVKAQEALDAENAGKKRSTLLEGLQAVLDKA